MLERNQEINLEEKDWEKSCKLGNMIYSLILGIRANLALLIVFSSLFKGMYKVEYASKLNE